VDGSASARLLILTVLCVKVVSRLLSNPMRRIKMENAEDFRWREAIS